MKSPRNYFLEGVLAFFVIVILASLMTPAIGPRRPRGRHPCLNNLHNVAIAIQNFASTNEGRLPPPTSGPQELSWRVLVLPALDHAWFYRKYHRDKPWNDPANDEYGKTKIPFYICPDNPMPQDTQGRYYSSYALLTGPGTAFDGPEPISIDDISDGVTQTILVVEACGANIVWNEPRDIDISREEPRIEILGKTQTSSNAWLSGHHVDWVNVAFADGSVRSLSINIDPKVLKTLATPNGDDRLDPNAY